jgi:pimeloyl-ACP methyl ester carboxylesterase
MFAAKIHFGQDMHRLKLGIVMEISNRTVEANGVAHQIAEAGTGPLVLLCHGFPEFWYSWRHQIEALAEAGYHAVAPDMRGYGRTGKPQDIDQYTLFDLVGDVIGLVNSLGYKEATIVGHDWGATVAWNAALLRPDVFRAIAALSVPFRPRGAVPPTSVMPQTDKAIFYQLYFQEPGSAEHEYGRDIRTALVDTMIGFSGDGQPGNMFYDAGMVPKTGPLFPASAPSKLPAWLTQDYIDLAVENFTRNGFSGALNWYRNIDRNWKLLAPWAGAKIVVPAAYIVGDRDLLYRFPGMPEFISSLKQHVPELRETLILQGCGHWTQQERPDEISAALLRFLKGLQDNQLFK